MSINIERVRRDLAEFDFEELFAEELGWSRPAARREYLEYKGQTFEVRPVAELARVVVLEVIAGNGALPDPAARDAIQRELAQRHHENLVIFRDQDATRAVWRWVKRENGRLTPREHHYFKGQPGDLFLGKLSHLFVDISELDAEGELPVVAVAGRLKDALDVERVTRRFYDEFSRARIGFVEYIQGIDDERDRAWYASVLLNRLMFIYFLQRKGFIDGGDFDYLQRKLDRSQAGTESYYRAFLRPLFFDGFARPESERNADVNRLLGRIPYLSGSIFLEHRIEEKYRGKIDVADAAFANILTLFGHYDWHLDDTPTGNPEEINPDVLGYIFEKYINQKEFGAYYTRPEITEYLCEQTIHRLILEKVNLPAVPGVAPARQFDSVPDLLHHLDARLCRELLHEVLPKLTLLDPACGSGAFLVAAMKTLIDVYSAVIGRVEFLTDENLKKEIAGLRRQHASINYFIKKQIIASNLFGVDIMAEAVEIAQLRLYLALVASVNRVEELEPLPNIDFNILAGNSLIGLLRVDEAAYNRRAAGGQTMQQMSMLHRPYSDLVREKNILIGAYRTTRQFGAALQEQRDTIKAHRDEANAQLNQLLLDQWKALKIKFEQAAWDDTRGKPGKPTKRDVRIEDIEALTPFHWGYEFDEVMNQRGGFDAIITNPPWETFKPQAKEFFAEHSALVTKNKMTIKEFERERTNVLRDTEVRDAWLKYLSGFPHQNAYFRAAPQYANQISVVNGRKAGTDINLYKLFLEQCYNLLRNDGLAGIITPGSVYTDLGAKQLREMLFGDCEVISLFGLTNEKYIFDAVHHAQKLCLLVFEKGRPTTDFSVAFRINPREAVSVANLDAFLNEDQQHIRVRADLIRRLSPDSLSVIEFKTILDVQIAEKMLHFPLLGERLDGTWNLELTREFHMTDDSHLFETVPNPGRLPLYEGKMIHQFTHQWGEPKYWIDEERARVALAHKVRADGTFDYERHRVAFRDVASSTNERTMIAAVIPPGIFFPHTVTYDRGVTGVETIVVTALLNSFVFDFMIRQRVTAHCSMFYVYQLPVPRLTAGDAEFAPIVERAARLICTTPEFDALAREARLRGHQDGVTDPAGRARLRAELDGMIAHLYGLTDEEFAYILTTFPLVDQSVKDAALAEYRRLAPTMPA